MWEFLGRAGNLAKQILVLVTDIYFSVANGSSNVWTTNFWAGPVGGPTERIHISIQVQG